MTRSSLPLDVQIACAVFHWQWRDDWQAWCPPGWPSRHIINAPYLEKLHALQAHGGAPYGSSGGIDANGRPIIPSYQYHPEATAILWDWLHAQPDIQQIVLTPLPIPEGSLRGVMPWRCEIVTSDRRARGVGDSDSQALCQALLAFTEGR